MSGEKDIKRKIKVREGQPPPPDERIDRYKNFEGLMTDYQDLAKNLHRRPLYKNPKLFFGIFLVLVIGYLLYLSVEEERMMQSNEAKAQQGAVMRPLFEKINISFEKVVVNVKEGMEIIDSSGTKLTIPPLAFVDAKGVSVIGEVNFEYREFHNPTDLYAAGVRMVTDSTNETILESAGMIEMKASQGGVPVYLAQGKEIEVEMDYFGQELASVNAYNFGLYFLDTLGHQWVLQDQPISVSLREADSIQLGDDNHTQDTLGQANFSGRLTQQIRVSRLGTFNCARPLSPKQQSTIALGEKVNEPFNFRFVDEDDLPIEHTGEIAAIYFKHNTVVYLFADLEGSFPIHWNPEMATALLLVDKNGVLYVLRTGDMNRVDSELPNQEQRIKLDRVSSEVGTSIALRKYLTTRIGPA